MLTCFLKMLQISHTNTRVTSEHNNSIAAFAFHLPQKNKKYESMNRLSEKFEFSFTITNVLSGIKHVLLRKYA
jgi:hypothetical protein